MSSEGYIATKVATSSSSEYNALTFVIRELLSTRSYVTLVQVIAVDVAGTVDVQPMVNQIDADGAPIPHGVVNGVPWFTLQAGLNAVILTPEVNDIGLCVFADRDISSVVVNKAISNPGSMRQSDMADGLYLGGYLNKPATQYIKMGPDGIEIVSPTSIALTAPTITLDASDSIALTAPEVSIDASSSATITTGLFKVNGPAQFSSTIDASGTVTAPEGVFGGKAFTTHKHGGVTVGVAQTTPPV